MRTFERWALKVEITDSCWLWHGSKFENGYGYFQNKKAHRVAYQFFKGDVPVGLELDHVCRVRHCVNPLHLEAVSHHVNIMRARNSEPCPHGSITRRRCKVCKADYMRQFWSTRRKHA